MKVRLEMDAVHDLLPLSVCTKRKMKTLVDAEPERENTALLMHSSSPKH